MIIRGIDFTSRPRPGKPLTCCEATFNKAALIVERMLRWPSFEQFEAALQQPGPWIAGIDFPFGFARRFIENIGWPSSWSGYVGKIASLDRPSFRQTLESYKLDRPEGDKEHRRATDVRASSISPQKLYGVPVGWMLFEGTQRLVATNVTIPGLQVGDPERIVVEAYPGILARRLIGRVSYKNDTRKKQTPEQHEARREIMRQIGAERFRSAYGFSVAAPDSLADDPSGDELDAMLCAVQAAWSWSMRHDGFGAPLDLDSLEGWIADPAVRN